jgi:hypothetical protein
MDSEEASESRGSYTSQKHIEEQIQIAKKLMELYIYIYKKAMEQLIILTLSSKAKKKANRNCRGQCTIILS